MLRSEAARAATESPLTQACERLAAAGVPDANREAIHMLAALHQCSFGEAWIRRSDLMQRDLRARWLELVARRAAGEPLAYVMGRAGFRNLSLYVDGRVLIPRPETEGVIDHVLDWGRQQGTTSWGSALDLGTGSGCLALALAAEGCFARIVGTDLSREALAVARLNKEAVTRAGVVEFREGPLFAPVAGERFDVIVSNPPYLTDSEFRGLEPGVRSYEPRAALAGGPDGLVPTRPILAGARERLHEGGLLVVEIDATRASETLDAARRAGWPSTRIEVDLFERPRYLIATKEG